MIIQWYDPDDFTNKDNIVSTLLQHWPPWDNAAPMSTNIATMSSQYSMSRVNALIIHYITSYRRKLFCCNVRFCVSRRHKSVSAVKLPLCSALARLDPNNKLIQCWLTIAYIDQTH